MQPHGATVGAKVAACSTWIDFQNTLLEALASDLNRKETWLALQALLKTLSAEYTQALLALLLAYGLLALYLEPRRCFWVALEGISSAKVVRGGGPRVAFLKRLVREGGIAIGLGPTAELDPFYTPRDEDGSLRQEARSCRKKGQKGLLIVGDPVAGKTRTALELVADLKPPYVIVWRSPIAEKDLEAAQRLPRRGGRAAILADDLLLSFEGVHPRLPRPLEMVLERGPRMVLVATARQERAPGDAPGLVRFTLKPVQRPELEALVERVATREKIASSRVWRRYAGHPGGLVAGLERMRELFDHLPKPECLGEDRGRVAQRILQAARLLWETGVRTLTLKRLRLTAVALGPLPEGVDHGEVLRHLAKLGFLTLEDQEGTPWVTSYEGLLSEAIPPALQEGPRAQPWKALREAGDAEAFSEIGLSRHARYELMGDPVDLEGAIAAWEEAIRLTPAGSPDWPMYLNNLGTGLRKRFARSGELADLERAIKAHEEALHLTPAGSLDRPSRLNNLGNGLSVRYARMGEVKDLERAIEAYEQALRETPGSPGRPTYLNNLGNGLRERYARSGELADLERAIRAHEEALHLTPPGSPDRPAYLNNLGEGLRARYAHTEKQEDLERAIALYEEALSETPPGSPDRAGYLNNLGNGLSDRYARSGELADLERAIRAHEEALHLTPPGSPDRLRRLNNLGNGLRARYAHTEKQEDLERAIALYEEALSETPPGSPERPMYLNNLGVGLRDRYAQSGGMQDLERAIALYEQALALISPGSPRRPTMLSNLAQALRDRYKRTEKEEDLARATQAEEEARRLTPEAPSSAPGG